MKEIRELDHRRDGGIDVRLLWEPQTDRVSLALMDEHSGESFSFEVAPDEALSAFHHPYAYASDRRRVVRTQRDPRRRERSR
jgi:hypothetical protein